MVARPAGGNQPGDVRLPACGSCRTGATGSTSSPAAFWRALESTDRYQRWWPWLRQFEANGLHPRRSLAVRRPAAPAVHGAVHDRADRGRPADDRRRNDHGRHHRHGSHRNRSRRRRGGDRPPPLGAGPQRPGLRRVGDGGPAARDPRPRLGPRHRRRPVRGGPRWVADPEGVGGEVAASPVTRCRARPRCGRSGSQP